MRISRSDIPFPPARWPFFYGWFIVFGGIVGAVMSVPGQTIGVAPFTESLIAALALDRMQLSTAYMLGTIGSALILTPAGWFFDRFGARITAALAAAGLGAVLLGLSRIDVIARSLAGAMGLPGSAWVTMGVAVVGFFLLRFLGQGVLTMASRNMVMKWFDHRRGLANGIMSMIVPPAFSLSVPFMAWVIDRRGWSGAWVAGGLVVGLGMTAFALVFFRDNPEACRLRPDGGMKPKAFDPAHHPAADFTLGQAMRSWTFWVFNFATAMMGLYLTAFAFHVESIFDKAGMDKDTAYWFFTPTAIVTVVTGFTAGWASDHIRLKWLLLAMLLSVAAAVGFTLAMEHASAAFYPLMLTQGFAAGLFGVMMTVSWARLFGRRHLGAVSGHNMAWTVLFSAIGPAGFAAAAKHTGSYAAALWACLGIVLLLALGALKADRPAAPKPSSQASDAA